MREKAVASATNSAVGRERVCRGRADRGQRMAAIVAAATVAIFVWCVIGATDAAAAPTCPGPTTTDGLACCEPGATPTPDDACQLSGGGQAASCPLAQLTSSGTCCPPGAAAQADGSCQANGFTVDGCPLGQLDKGGLTCCGSGQTPQADGSCKQTSAANQSKPTMPAAVAGISACPSGFVYQPAMKNCTGAPTGCGAPLVTIPGQGDLLNVPLAPVTGNSVSGVTNTPFILGCCPWPSQQIDPTSACYEGVGASLVAVPPVPPVCPPGSAPNNFWNTGVYFCVAKPACPPHFYVDATSGSCDFDPIAFNANALKEIALNDTGPCKNNSVPRRGFVGDDACVTVAAAALTLLQNTAAPSHTKPDGTCLPGYAWRSYGPSDRVCVSTTQPPAQSRINCAAGFARDDKGKCIAVTGNCRAGAVQIDGKCVDLPKQLPELKIPPGGAATPGSGSQVHQVNPTGCGANQILYDGLCICDPASGLVLMNGTCVAPAQPPPGQCSIQVPGGSLYCAPLTDLTCPGSTQSLPGGGCCPPGSFPTPNGACVTPGGGTCDGGPTLCCPPQSMPNFTTGACMPTPPSPTQNCQVRGGTLYCAAMPGGGCPQGSTASNGLCLANGPTCPNGNALALCCPGNSQPDFGRGICCQDGKCTPPGPTCSPNDKLLANGLCCPQT